MSDPRPSQADSQAPKPAQARRRRSLFPGGLVGMLVLVVLVERYVWQRRVDFLDLDHWLYLRAARAADREAKKYDVLCLGDSLMKVGFVPRAVGERSGLRAYNLAVSGSQALTNYFLLRRVLDSGARPKAIVVDFHAALLRFGPRNSLAGMSSTVSPVEAAQIGWWAGDREFFTWAMLGRTLPSFLARGGLRANAKAALAGTSDLRHYQYFWLHRNWAQNEGAQLHPPALGLADLTDPQIEHLRREYYPEWACHPANVLGVAKFLGLAAEHHLPVYWVLPPNLPKIHRGLEQSGFNAQHEAFVRPWLEKYPNLIVVDGRGKLNDATGFFDAYHLSAGASYGLGLALGDVLAQTLPDIGAGTERLALPGSRWIALPEFRPVPLPEGVEDLDQSVLALKSRGEATARR